MFGAGIARFPTKEKLSFRINQANRVPVIKAKRSKDNIAFLKENNKRLQVIKKRRSILRFKGGQIKPAYNCIYFKRFLSPEYLKIRYLGIGVEIENVQNR